ncbi:MAG: hypothetical protein GW906_06050 [Epsilonproteobacteria bacterium]|nr:hypothetical protein [Campylobacterota bacterium]OIO14979.1 MAG: hypothetical protein AUJ81_07970 [Helicobacteraceae bacterium CG1_02_36_14]PIP10564.1 MAG: hypothetical protein COX50_05555 [Sulfurimonas sp. CG23_combo_of_CG06-09_8_20_14_all_36_33]PIS27014.1 MAG: hypothetical protein COT46_00830 [Sulfurimonas sp. CG08_land_8_20_14_0_20_36_33]PIU35908.1 MAG: hypothetical protein COT05_01805 [Sulfurimonas sp. CG07_land_8_20_14_0_80_36_56]PIV03485.1 MAG: hypothetical protein COS56_08660 [Sulfur
MGIKKFIKSVTDYLGLDKLEEMGKKKSLKNILSKLKTRRVKILNSIKNREDESKCDELQEELDIVNLQLKKGKQILNKLQKQ